MRSSLIVIIPCYDAGSRLRGAVERARAIVDRVIVIDDGSNDGAVAALVAEEAAHPSTPPLDFITFPRNRGKGFALLEGFRAAVGFQDAEAVVTLDADGQHDPSEIPALYEAFKERAADLVIGARTFDRRAVPWRSRFGNRLTALVTQALLRRRLPDTQSGFRLHARSFVEDVLATIPGGRYETEMAIVIKAIREHYSLVSVPIQTIYEPGNISSHFRVLTDSFRIYALITRALFLRNRPPARPD